MSTAILMKRLMEIDAACSPHRKQKEQEEREKNLDQFTIEKRKMAEFIREIRKDIQDRDLLYQNDNRSEAVKKGAIIRQKLKEATARAEELEKVQKKKHKKLKQQEKIKTVSEEKKKKDENREQVVVVMYQHLKELERKEKNVRADRDDVYQSDSDAEEMKEISANSGIPELDDPRYELLRKNDEEIDELLDVTLQGVRRLKALANEINAKVVESDDLISEVKNLADETLGKLDTVNGQLKKTLKEARSPGSFCCDIILCVMILGIITAIYFVATKNS